MQIKSQDQRKGAGAQASEHFEVQDAQPSSLPLRLSLLRKPQINITQQTYYPKP